MPASLIGTDPSALACHARDGTPRPETGAGAERRARGDTPERDAAVTELVRLSGVLLTVLDEAGSVTPAGDRDLIAAFTRARDAVRAK